MEKICEDDQEIFDWSQRRFNGEEKKRLSTSGTGTVGYTYGKINKLQPLFHSVQKFLIDYRPNYKSYIHKTWRRKYKRTSSSCSM